MPTHESVERYRLLALDYATKEGLADTADAKRKIIFAELVNHYRGTEKSIGGAEYRARADPRFIEAEELRSKSRTAANLAKAEVKAKEIAFEFWRTREATKRQEMKL